MHTNSTAKTENNDLADRIVQERALVSQLSVLIEEMDFGHKIAVAQFACNLIGSTQLPQLVSLRPFGAKFDNQCLTAIKLMGSLSADALADVAIKILEEPRDCSE